MQEATTAPERVIDDTDVKNHPNPYKDPYSGVWYNHDGDIVDPPSETVPAEAAAPASDDAPDPLKFPIGNLWNEPLWGGGGQHVPPFHVRSIVLYDCEIKKSIPDKGQKVEDKDKNYCKGWGDRVGMGISVIVAFDYLLGQTRLFTDDNFHEFVELVARRDWVVGFNNVSFDDPLVTAHGAVLPPHAIDGPTGSFDIMKAVKERPGLDRFAKGYKLGNLAAAIGAQSKDDGAGIMAPVWYREAQDARDNGDMERYVELLTKLHLYCKKDVVITRQVFEYMFVYGHLIDPNTNQVLPIEHPWRVPPAQEATEQVATEGERGI